MWNDDTPADQERGPCYRLGNREMYIYLHDSHFKLITDCKPVQLIFNNNPKSKRIEHWNLRVQGYDFDVAHIAGTQVLMKRDSTRGIIMSTSSLPMQYLKPICQLFVSYSNFTCDC